MLDDFQKLIYNYITKKILSIRKQALSDLCHTNNNEYIHLTFGIEHTRMTRYPAVN